MHFYLVLSLLIACSGSEPCEQAWWRDADGDGSPGRAEVLIACDAPEGFVDGPEDCDDGDPDTHVGAAEVCDGRDNDCDGAIDEDPIDAPPAWRDGDGDGFGGSGPAESASCTPQAGWVTQSGDCDDGDPEIHPLAEETCDLVDRNCDGDPTLDAVDTLEWYADLDGDGTGDPDNAGRGCGAPPPGWTEDASDCDDGDPEVFVGAVENAADGVDSNCDGLELCFRDDDGDGWAGDVSVVANPACSIPPAAPLVGDCDDQNAAVNDGLQMPAEFVEIGLAVGLDQIQWDPVLHPATCAVDAEWMAGGAAVGDYDGDGRLDLFLPRVHLADLLLWQRADGTYEERAALVGLDWDGASSSAVWFDADADGDLDLYVAMVGRDSNRLYIQQGGTFTEEAALRGAELPLADPLACSLTFSVSAGDADGDGDIDLITGGWQPPQMAGTERSRLLLNDGSGFFADGSLTPGLQLGTQAGFTPALVDHDQDGDQDLAVIADFGTSRLYERNGDYVDVTRTIGLGTDQAGMGGDWADIDQDGHLDWFVTSIYGPGPAYPFDGNRLYKSDGAGAYVDHTDAAGVRDGGWGWGAAFFDVDHDGDVDLAQQNGWPHEPAFAQDRMRLFINDGTGAFDEQGCSHGADLAGQGRAVVPFDHDGDGDLDLLLVFAAERPRLLRNDGADSAGHWLSVSLEDPGSANPRGLGAVVSATAGGQTQQRWVHANSTFGAVGPASAHFGLGAEALVDLEIRWPDGGLDLLLDQPADQALHVVR